MSNSSIYCWPPFDVRLITQNVSLATTADEDLASLIGLMNEGIHEANQRPFSTTWNLIALPERNHEFVRRIWSNRAKFKAEDWVLDMTVRVNNKIVGMQSVYAKDFVVARTFVTSSWLGKNYQRQGFGTLARRAVLYLMFEGLFAIEGHSEVYEDNLASLKVAQKLGYVENGFRTYGRDHKKAKSLQYVITKEIWGNSNNSSNSEIIVSDLKSFKEFIGV